MSSFDVLSWGGLDISFQRFGRSAWSSSEILRSWAGAPWSVLRDGGIAVACFPSEGVWFGLTAVGAATRVRFESQSGRAARDLNVPPDWQLGWVQSAGRKRPIALRRECQSAAFILSVSCPTTAKPKTRMITLLAPEAWRLRVGLLELQPAEAPEPVLLYSRIMPARGDGKR